MAGVEDEDPSPEGLNSADSRIKVPEYSKGKVTLVVDQKEEDLDLQEDSPIVIRYDNVLICFFLGNYSFYFSHLFSHSFS